MNTDMTDEQGEGAEGRGGAWTEQRRRSDEGRRPVKRDGEVGGAPEASERQGTSGRGLKLHHLRPAPGAHKAKTRVGRGEASKGKTAGRGTKGTKARTQVRVGFEGGQMPLHRRVPKLKGFSNAGFGTTYQVVN